MKKTTPKLALRPHTIAVLDTAALGRVVGGSLAAAGLDPAVPGFIMKDSIIVRTSR